MPAALVAIAAAAVLIFWVHTRRGLARYRTIVTPLDSKVLVACGQYEENVSYWTKSPSSVIYPVSSEEACEEQCRARAGESCGAWTWGKQRDVFGLTDVCLLQALSEGEQVQRREKLGVVSGILSEFNCNILSEGNDSLVPNSSTDVREEAPATTTSTKRRTTRTVTRTATTSKTSTTTSTLTTSTQKTTTSTQKTTSTAKTTSTVKTTGTVRTETLLLDDDLKCSPVEDNIDYWTMEALGSAYPVNRTEDCARMCADNEDCGAWTWGKARDLIGATDTCFLKKLAAEDRPVLHRKAGVVSGVSCRGRSEGIPDQPDNSNMFCFALMMPTGYEVRLIKMQYDKHLSIFACDEYEIYSNAYIDIAPGVTTGKVDSDLKCGRGGEFGTALNKDIFEAVWDSVVQDDRFSAHHWTVKADPDCVFFPDRLRVTLQKYSEDPEEGLYINNCKFGMHGPLEIFSRNAVVAWTSRQKECEDHFSKLCNGDCYWGEDMFIDQCLDKVIDVKRVEEYWILLEDHCDPPDGWDTCKNYSIAAFHPFKDEGTYMGCWTNSTSPR